MPITCREAHRKLKDAGAYQVRNPRGSHEIWKHDLVPDGFVTLPCHSQGYEIFGDVEQNYRRFLKKIEEAKRRKS